MAEYFGEDFGQKIDLTVRIREILRNYPEGTSILKEIIQNADDAGAKQIKFCLDNRTHPSESLAYSKLATFQGKNDASSEHVRLTTCLHDKVPPFSRSMMPSSLM